ncbi:hypothetical protein [Streptomyces yangpuensis]|uniref:hypothetical protein n=1 Tax=Streptomyces yangpuensis TaxID=1648182 RepID=UPI0037133A0B
MADIRDLGLCPGRDAHDGHQPKDLERDERAELAELRRENRRLREDIEILKRAWAGGPRRPA